MSLLGEELLRLKLARVRRKCCFLFCFLIKRTKEESKRGLNEVSKESSDSATNIRRKGPDGGGNSKGGKSLLMCNMDSFNSFSYFAF